MVGKASPAVATGWNRLQPYGNNASSTGPHMQAFTPADDYPLIQHLNYTHDNITLNFHCHWDGKWRSSYATKSANALNFNYSPGATPGSTISSIPNSKALTITTTGQVRIPVNLYSWYLY